MFDAERLNETCKLNDQGYVSTFQHQTFNYGRFYKLVENEQILVYA
jgi:hypothetical protein